MGVIKRTPAADFDLEELWFYVAIKDSEKRADGLLDELAARFIKLSDFPYMGADITGEFTEDTRFFPVGSINIFYRPIDGGIEIYRVIHAARDLSSLF